MFRATSCSSSGGQIVLIQYLVSSPSVNGHPVHRLRVSYRFADSLWAGAFAPAYKLSAILYDNLNLCTGRPLTESDDTRCCINTTLSPDDEQEQMLLLTSCQQTCMTVSICAPDGLLQTVTIPDAVLIQLDILMMSRIKCSCSQAVSKPVWHSQPVHRTVTYRERRYQMLY